MSMPEIIGDKREQILALAKQCGIYNVRVFGSVARGEVRPDSDADFVVDVEPGVSMGFVRLWADLEDLLGRKVDLLTERSLPPRMRERVLRDAVPL